MATTRYHWTPYTLTHRLYPLFATLAWWAVWLSPPGQWLHQALVAAVPSPVLAPLGLGVLTAVITYGTIAFFHRCDTTGKPEWLAKRKLQQPFSDPRRPSTGEALKVHAINHSLLVVGLVALGFGLELRGWSSSDEPAAWYWVGAQLVALGVLTEFFFFSAHRILHIRWLYKRIHVVHHRFRAPTAWSAQFAHPIEYVFGNMLPIALPILIVSPDLLTLWNFGLLALLNTQLVHSGYQLPLAPWSVAHDLHHFKVNVNYGSIGLMDTLAGTRMKRLDDPRYTEATDSASTPAAENEVA
jgi:sterol desaturase/sphingolipid hydroxylase (fatty acid hydroxylase superfamily)